MPFQPNIPQPTDNLKTKSQADLLANNQALDAVFGVDHYKFSSTTNEGMHNTVTTPPCSPGVPATIADQCKIFAFAPAGNAGLIQYSKPPSDGTPTPLTGIHSNGAVVLAAGASIPILNFTGSPIAFCRCYAIGNSNTQIGQGTLLWNNGVSSFSPSGGSLEFSFSASTLSLKNNGATANVYWSLVFDRLGPT